MLFRAPLWLTSFHSFIGFSDDFYVRLAERKLARSSGGSEKMLAFTYIDDCVDGLARGVEALHTADVVNETINLAYGSGNTLVRAGELIAGALGVEPEIVFTPSLWNRWRIVSVARSPA